MIRTEIGFFTCNENTLLTDDELTQMQILNIQIAHKILPK